MPERSRRWADVDPVVSHAMSRVPSKDTTPELVVRKLAHALGYRFRLHRKDLPGTPDLVFPSRRKVVFVHGCFWHGHTDPSCRLSRTPKSRMGFWQAKLERNRARDARNETALREAGWDVLTVWECELAVRDRDALASRLSSWLDGER
jgi:DNA mismatch endonuclease, patch repair protein